MMGNALTTGILIAVGGAVIVFGTLIIAKFVEEIKPDWDRKIWRK